MINYTEIQEKAINDYLMECVKNNYHCQHCTKNHNGICFFAFQCFANDMMHFDDCCEDNYIPDDVDESNYDPYCGCDMFEICGSIDEEW